MKAGEFPDGSRTLRAKIDMASPNLNMRDPVMYRILHAEHHRTGNKWCIYPMYDYAHGQSRFDRSASRTPSARWNSKTIARSTTGTSKQLGIYHPQQIEFDRLNLTYTLLSKRKLLHLVQEGHVRGWDDPRMPTLSGIRRRGYTPEAMRNFCAAIGVSKTNGTIELGLLEHYVREDLNKRAPRVMAVLRPLKVVIDNYPEGQVEEMDAVNNPEDASAGTRKVPFSQGALHRAGRFPRRSAEAVSSASRPAAKCACATATSSRAPSVVKNDAGRSGGGPLHLRPRHPRRQRARRPQGEVDHSLGLRRACRRCAKSASTTTCSLKENPNEVAEGQDFTAQPESQFARRS